MGFGLTVRAKRTDQGIGLNNFAERLGVSTELGDGIGHSHETVVAHLLDRRLRRAPHGAERGHRPGPGLAQLAEVRFELRDRVEQWVMALADGKLPEGVSAKVDLEDLARGPSIYLRLPEAEAHSVEGIRKAAKSSLRDGFSGGGYAIGCRSRR